MKIAIVGGGIAGLSLALSLHQHGIACEVYEQVPQLSEVGVGITLLPHAMRELATLGLQPALEAVGIENVESVFFNRYGQFIYSEPRGRCAGYVLPELGLRRGTLHRILYEAVVQRLGKSVLHLDHRCVGTKQTEVGVTVSFESVSTRKTLPSVDCDVLIACDGVNSAVRKQIYPHEKIAFTGINTWRGVTVHKPILTGKSYLRVGTIETGKMVIYPIADNVDGQGNQLINWVAEIQSPGEAMNDWNQTGNADDFLDIFKHWQFDWLDVPALIRGATQILKYPMVDKDPIPQWTFNRLTLVGDAAHPMYPRGSNGSAQALIDARTLANQLAHNDNPIVALKAYETLRLEPTAKVVFANRSVPPDFIIKKVDELSGGKPFNRIEDVISQAELQAISDNYKTTAGFSVEALRVA